MGRWGGGGGDFTPTTGCQGTMPKIGGFLSKCGGYGTYDLGTVGFKAKVNIILVNIYLNFKLNINSLHRFSYALDKKN